MRELLDGITAGLHQVIAQADEPVPLHEPEFGAEELALVADCIETGWVSSAGRYVEAFEQNLAAACDVSNAVAVVNGTAALQVALIVGGVRPGDEVLVPALTFVATANAVCHAGAAPHFVDSEAVGGGVDPVALQTHLSRVALVKGGECYNRETGRRIACVVPMHLFGHPADMTGISEVANRWGIVIVEDAAEALGSRLNGKSMGSYGKLASLSFNGNKIITTGGGGAILTDDNMLAKRAKHLTTTAKVPHAWAFEHDEISFNFRLPNLNAALGVAQLAKLETRLDKKRRLALRYAKVFQDVEGVAMFQPPPGATSNYWLNALVLEPEYASSRDELLNELNKTGFMVRPAWTLMSRLSMFDSSPRAPLNVAEDLERRIICLPSSAHLADQS